MPHERINRRQFVRAVGIAVAVIVAALLTSARAVAQDEGPARRAATTSGRPAWFGLPLPDTVATLPPVVVGTRGPRPVTLPAGEPAYPELQGAAIRKDLEAVVGDREARAATARKSAVARSGAAFPASRRVRRQRRGRPIEFRRRRHRRREGADRSRRIRPPAASGCRSRGTSSCSAIRRLAPAAPTSCSQSAMPLAPSAIPGGELTAPLVYVGNGSPAMLSHVDVKGKIAVQLDDSAGAHGVRARLGGAAGAGAVQARRGRGR